MNAVKKEQKAKQEFPCLMESTVTGAVMLITAVDLYGQLATGTCITAGGEDSLGKYSSNWDAPSLKPYMGEVILSN